MAHLPDLQPGWHEPLGALARDGGVNFAFASEHATRIELCVFDAEGPCANAVRDAQRTKTADETRATLSVIWGCVGLEQRLAATERWYRDLLESAGASTERASLVTATDSPH